MEIARLQRGLQLNGVRIPSHILEKGLIMPEDSVIPEEYMEDRAGIIADMLFKNPAPKPKKKKKGKK